MKHHAKKDFYVLSTRKINFVPSNGCAAEIEDLAVHICNARIITPVLTKGSNVPTLAVPLHLNGTPAERVLIIVALALGLTAVLQAVPGWRKAFSTVLIYVIDPWINWTNWPDQAPRDVDAYFVPDIRVAEHYRNVHGVKAHPIALAADVLRFGSNRKDRPLDVVAYGRQHAEYLNIIRKAFNDPRSPRFIYHDTLSSAVCSDFRSNRNLIWKLLHKSRVSLCFDVLATPDTRKGDRARSIIPLRYYEAAAAGTAIVGRHPSVPEMTTEFNWPDATIKLPESPADALAYLESLLDDRDRLSAIHVRNHAEAWRRHDWRYRFRDMFRHLNLPLPARLLAELGVLESQPIPCEAMTW